MSKGRPFPCLPVDFIPRNLSQGQTLDDNKVIHYFRGNHSVHFKVKCDLSSNSHPQFQQNLFKVFFLLNVSLWPTHFQSRDLNFISLILYISLTIILKEVFYISQCSVFRYFWIQARLTLASQLPWNLLVNFLYWQYNWWV